MLRFLIRRIGLSIATLFLLSIMVFLGGQVLPGNVGRAILGPLADARAVAMAAPHPAVASFSPQAGRRHSPQRLHSLAPLAGRG